MRACAVWLQGWPFLTYFAVLGGHVVFPVESICARHKAAASEEPSWTSQLSFFALGSPLLDGRFLEPE